MKTALDWEQIRKDNPHFIGNDLSFDYFKDVKTNHWCCDVVSAAKHPHGGTIRAKAPYEYFNDKWCLVAN